MVCCPRTSRSSVLVVLAVLLLGLSPEQLALGQQLVRPLPDPISDHELVHYMELLRLSAEQRVATQALHQEYWNSYEVLRQSDIRRFSRDTRGRQREDAPYDRRSLEQYLRSVEELLSRIESLDREFLASLEITLAEQQLAPLELIRLRRERARLRRLHSLDLIAWSHIDLVDAMNTLDLTPTDAEAFHALLASYERRLTTMMRETAVAATRTHVEWLGLYSTIDSDDVSLEDWRRIMRAFIARARTLLDLHFLTYRQLKALLSPRDAHALQGWLCRVAYRDALLVTRSLKSWAAAEEALRSSDSSREQRRALELFLTDLHGSFDPIIDDALRVVHTYPATIDPVMMDEETDQQYWVTLRKLRDKAVRIDRRALVTLTAVLNGVPPHVGRRQTAGLRVQSDSSGLRQLDAELKPSPGQLTGEHDPALFARLMELDEPRGSTVAELYESFLEDWQQHVAPLIGELRVATSRLRAAMSQGEAIRDYDPATPHKLRFAIHRASEDVEGRFFDAIAILLDTPDALARLQHTESIRGRERLLGYTRRLRPSVPAVSTVDVMRLLFENPTLSFDGDDVAEVLEDYERRFSQLVQIRFEKEVERQHQAEEALFASAVLHLDGASGTEVDEHMAHQAAVIDNMTRELRAMDGKIASVNHYTVEVLGTLLPNRDASLCLGAFSRQAYAHVYRDAAKLDAVFAALLHRIELSPAQRSRVRDLAAEYRLTYNSLTDQMIEICARAAYSENWMEEQQEEESSLALLRLKRDGVNARTARTLVGIVDRDDIAAVGGIPIVDGSSQSPR